MPAPSRKGHGGARPGAGRKPKTAAPTVDELQTAESLLAGKTVEQLMEIAVGMAAAKGRWDEVSKAGARLLNARARSKAPPPPPDAPQPSRFVPRPPPAKPN